MSKIKNVLFVASACRHKVVGRLKKQFKTPKDAVESSYSGHQDLDTASLVVNTTENNVSVTESLEVEPSVLERYFNQLPVNAQLDLLSKLFSSYASSEMRLSVPDDFIVLAARAMLQLTSSGRSNVLYNLAKAIGTIREDGSDSRLPTKRMPMGLMEYIAILFVADNLQSVSHICHCMIRIINANFTHRSHALWIIVFGSRQCIVFLARSGLFYTMAQCGVLCIHCRFVKTNAVMLQRSVLWRFVYIVYF